jgi:hypothetical protein
MRGRQKAFYASSWNADIRVTKSIASTDTTIEIAAMDYAGNFPLVADFGVLTAGEMFGCRVTDCDPGDPGKEILTLSGAFGADVALADICKTCRLVLSRFDADRIEIQYGRGGSAFVSVPTVECPE